MIPPCIVCEPPWVIMGHCRYAETHAMDAKAAKVRKMEWTFRAFCVYRRPHSSICRGFLKCTHEPENLPLSRCGLDFGRKGKKAERGA